MKTRPIILLSAAALFAAVSCQKAENPEQGGENEEKLTAPVLTADVEKIEISEIGDGNALTLSWTAAAETGVNYTLQYGLTDGGSTKAVKCGQELSKKFSVSDIDAIREELGVAEQTAFSLSVLVEAKSSAVALPVSSNAVSVDVSYNIPEPEPLELYGIGDAFSWAWDRSAAEKMSTEDHVHFTWEGWLESGNGKMFKFLTNESISNESWYPNYGRNGASEDNYWALAEFRSADDGDTQFKVDKSGNYLLSVDVENMVMTAEFKGDGKQHFYGIGETFAWAWKLGDAEEFSSDDQKVWTWTGDVVKGGFKIMLSNTDWSKGYNWDKTADGGEEPSGDETTWTAFLRDENVSKDNDDYFKFSKDGNYTVTFDLAALKVTVKYNGKRSDWKPDTNYDMDGMYLYGAWGWSISDAKAMSTTDNDTYTYEGNIKKDDLFNIMCKSGKWWPRFVRDEGDASKMVYHKSEGEGTSYWKITDEDGWYRITATVSTLEISITRLGDTK